MTNYIIIPHITDEQDAAYIEKEIKTHYPRHIEEQTDEISYIGFAARERSEVEDKVRELLHNIGIGTEDYLALYYTKDGNADQIVRAMILGHDQAIESDLQRIKPEDHVDTLSRLLNHDFVKSHPNPGQR